MGDNLVPNGLSRGGKAFCSRSKYPKPAGWEVRRVRWPVPPRRTDPCANRDFAWSSIAFFWAPARRSLFSGR